MRNGKFLVTGGAGTWSAPARDAGPDRVPPIRAAGGVVWRGTGSGVEVCLVHRPRYDDWSLPKGKLEPGEHPLVAAVREVAEEAGVRGLPQVRLPTVRYFSQGRPKTVAFWSMRALDDGQPGTPTDHAAGPGAGGGPGQPYLPDGRADHRYVEVDGMCWLPLAAAVRKVSYPHDATVLRAFAALPPVTVALGLVRPGPANGRSTWPGLDAERPLDPAGRAEARALAPVLALLRPERLVSASPRRCRQTLHPVARLVGRPVEVDPAFDEPGQNGGAAALDAGASALDAATRLAELAQAGISTVVCSQGTVIPHVLERSAGTATPAERDAGMAGYATVKGAGWLLAFTGGQLVAADRLTAPEG